jgi:hypothetical protein
MPSLGGAEWLNPEPLIPAELWGCAVLVNFWKLFLEPGTEAYSFRFGWPRPGNTP